MWKQKNQAGFFPLDKNASTRDRVEENNGRESPIVVGDMRSEKKRVAALDNMKLEGQNFKTYKLPGST